MRQGPMQRARRIHTTGGTPNRTALVRDDGNAQQKVGPAGCSHAYRGKQHARMERAHEFLE